MADQDDDQKKLAMAPPDAAPKTALPVATIAPPGAPLPATPPQMAANASAPQLPGIAPPTALPAPAMPNPVAPPGMPQNNRIPSLPPPQIQSGGARLWDKASGVPGAPGVLDKIGAGIARAADVVGEGISPRIAALVPGSETNTRLQNKENEAQFERRTTQGIEQEKADTEQGKEQTAEETARRNSENVPVTLSNGQTVYVPQKDAARLLGTTETNQTKEKTTSETNATKLDVADLESKNRAAIAAGKPQPTKTIMQGGAPHIMERDPKTGEYSIDRGEAPPNYAQIAPSLKTIDVIDPTTGLPTVETLSGKPLGVSATGAYGHEMAQAGAVDRAGNQLITELHDPTNREILGKLNSYIKEGTLGTPLADARAAKLSAELKTFAALQPSMHGFKARSSQEAFEKIIGGLAQDPDATIGSIEGILQTAANIKGDQGGGGGGFKVPEDAPAAPKEDGKLLKSGGKVIGVSKGGKWQAPPTQSKTRPSTQ